MDHRVILAVAGSGKTTYIINLVDTAKLNLLMTYTVNNYRNMKKRILQKPNLLPRGTHIYTYFSFIYTFCLLPLCGDRYKLRGINFDHPQDNTRFIKQDRLDHYIDKSGRIYSSRIAKFIINFGFIDEVRNRIEKYFQNIYVDEVQDFAGYDFAFLGNITTSNINSLLVGDFYQHTYDTSRDGSMNKNLHDDYDAYKRKLQKLGFYVDDEKLNQSYRCYPTTCNFISDKLGIIINSHIDSNSILEFIDDVNHAEEIFYQKHIVKLFYQDHHRYPCTSNNWGACKGIDDYDSVCVVLNKKTEEYYKNNDLEKLPSITKNKLYVACTRARSQLYFVPERFYKKF